MRRCLNLGPVITAVALALASVPGQAVADPVPNRVVTGINGAESAFWDVATGAWYISSGGFSGSGSVVKLRPDSDTPETFVDGLNGPQGVTIHNGTMYIADGDHVQVVEMANPANQQSIPTGGSASDVSVDPVSGDLFVSDLGGGKVWRIHNGVSAAFADINSPDGIYVLDGGVFIANFALGGPGGIFRIDIATKAITTVSDIPLATLDGLEPDGADWLATDFTKGHFWRVAPGGTFTPIGQLLPGTADIGFDRETRTVAVPNLLFNFVAFFTV